MEVIRGRMRNEIAKPRKLSIRRDLGQQIHLKGYALSPLWAPGERFNTSWQVVSARAAARHYTSLTEDLELSML